MRGRSAVVETLAVYGGTILALRVLNDLSQESLVGPYLYVLVPAIFIYVPIAVILIRKASPGAYGITLNRPFLSLKIALVTSLVVLPSFALAFHVYTRTLFGTTIHPALPNLDTFFRLSVQHFLCIALAEEIFYRGYIQSRMNAVWKRPRRILGAPVGMGLIYANLLFAIGHPLVRGDVASLATFFPGLLFGWLRERCDSVLASTLFHGACNLTMIMLQGAF